MQPWSSYPLSTISPIYVTPEARTWALSQLYPDDSLNNLYSCFENIISKMQSNIAIDSKLCREIEKLHPQTQMLFKNKDLEKYSYQIESNRTAISHLTTVRKTVSAACSTAVFIRNSLHYLLDSPRLKEVNELIASEFSKLRKSLQSLNNRVDWMQTVLVPSSLYDPQATVPTLAPTASQTGSATAVFKLVQFSVELNKQTVMLEKCWSLINHIHPYVDRPSSYE